MNINNIRHSLAHIMAAAVKELYPGVKFGVGPAIENGFYYDFALPSEVPLVSGTKKGLSLADLPKIEKKMKELIKKDLKFVKKEISKKEAKKIFKDQLYKLELIKKGESILHQDALQQMKFRTLSKGIISISLALGIFIAHLLETYTALIPIVSYISMILLFFGIGSLVFYYIVKNK